MEIRLENVWYRYDGVLGSDRDVLRGVSLKIQQGEFVGLVGRSGSGKTTLLQHFTALLTPLRGRVLVDGVDINRRGVDLADIRRRIGLVFQFPEMQLFEETVAKDVAFGPRNLGLPEETVEKRVREALEQVGLAPEVFRDRNPHRLSEGEKRRVALAGVLAMRPEVLVLDEPTAGLDPKGTATIEKILVELHGQGKSIVLVSHNMDLVARRCQRIVALREGEVVFDGPRGTFFENEHLVHQLGLKLPRLLVWWKKKRRGRPELPAAVYSLEELRRVVRQYAGVRANKVPE